MTDKEIIEGFKRELNVLGRIAHSDPRGPSELQKERMELYKAAISRLQSLQWGPIEIGQIPNDFDWEKPILVTGGRIWTYNNGGDFGQEPLTDWEWVYGPPDSNQKGEVCLNFVRADSYLEETVEAPTYALIPPIPLSAFNQEEE